LASRQKHAGMTVFWAIVFKIDYAEIFIPVGKECSVVPTQIDRLFNIDLYIILSIDTHKVSNTPHRPIASANKPQTITKVEKLSSTKYIFTKCKVQFLKVNTYRIKRRQANHEFFEKNHLINHIVHSLSFLTDNLSAPAGTNPSSLWPTAQRRSPN
jgi:hypothetical protein